MKHTLLMTTALLAMGIAPALAEDGRVSHSTLSTIGLGGMHAMTDSDGMSIRGGSSYAYVSGSSLAFGQIVRGDDFFVASATNRYGSSETNGGLNPSSRAGGGGGVNISGGLRYGPRPSYGMFSGGAGGGGFASAGFGRRR